MEYWIRAERPVAETLAQLEEGLREGGWEVGPRVDLALWVPGREGPVYLVEAIHPPAGEAERLGLGRFLLYPEANRTIVALLDTSFLALGGADPPFQAEASEPSEELLRLLRRLGQPVEMEAPLDRFDEGVSRRLNRIEGQIRGLQKMLAENRECEAILTQLAAVNGALKQVAASLLSTYLIRCVREDLERGGDGSAVNRKLLSILF